MKHLHEVYHFSGTRVGALGLDHRGVVALGLDDEELGVYPTSQEAVEAVLKNWHDIVQVSR